MSTPSENLAELGLSLPTVATPLAAYVPSIRVGTQIWTSGQLPTVDGQLKFSGLLGRDLVPENGAQAAKVAALNALAAAAAAAGGLDQITRVLKVVVYVASAPSFEAQPAVANGASELLGAVFGDAGAHVRSAVGAAMLPLNSPVEVELIVDTA
jgi:enamine deaminase RidA (YjgF/YER057c/UK114 family)